MSAKHQINVSISQQDWWRLQRIAKDAGLRPGTIARTLIVKAIDEYEKGKKWPELAEQPPRKEPTPHPTQGSS